MFLKRTTLLSSVPANPIISSNVLLVGRMVGRGALKTKSPVFRGSAVGCGGRGEIRTHGGLSSSPVFKTGAFNRSATLPFAISALDYK